MCIGSHHSTGCTVAAVLWPPSCSTRSTCQGCTQWCAIQIFVEDNYGTDSTRMGRVLLEGFLTPTYNVEYKQ